MERKMFGEFDPDIAKEFVKPHELGPHGESPALDAYKCPGGIWTIGWGHTAGVKEGQHITEEDAERFLSADLKRHAAQLATSIKVFVTKNQFIAILDWAFNVGVGAAKDSKLVQFLNQSKYDLAASQFSRWKYSNGKVLPGLETRRKHEADKFLSGES
jgi:lysozyme